MLPVYTRKTTPPSVRLLTVSGRRHFQTDAAHATRPPPICSGKASRIVHEALVYTLRHGPGAHLQESCPHGGERLIDQPEAREILVETFVPRIRRTVRALCQRQDVNDSCVHQDIAQEAALLLHRKAERWEGRAQLSTWVCKIIMNLILDFKRGRFFKTPTLPDIAFGNLEADEASDPIANSQHREAAAKIQQAIDRLSPKLQAILRAWIAHEGEYNGIAAQLGIGLGTVKSRLNRAKRELGKLLPADRSV